MYDELPGWYISIHQSIRLRSAVTLLVVLGRDHGRLICRWDGVKCAGGDVAQILVA
jgi:hypothetical protein